MPYLYTGRRLDTFAGQYFNRNRYYNPRYGRFISSDPISFQGGNNLYVYANQNPLRYTDPSGKFVWAIPMGILLETILEILANPQPLNDNVVAFSLLLEDSEKNVDSLFPTPCDEQLVKAKEKLKQLRNAEEDHGYGPQEHHSYPVYLGGNINQETTLLRWRSHSFLHSRLDKYDNGQWARKKGADWFVTLPHFWCESAVRNFYSSDLYGFFTPILPDFEKAAAKSKASRPEDNND